MTFITFHRRRRILVLSCGTQPCAVGVKRFLIVNAGEILCRPPSGFREQGHGEWLNSNNGKTKGLPH